MTSLADIPGISVTGHKPWPRLIVQEPQWHALGKNLADGTWSLFGLWADEQHVHAAVQDSQSRHFAVLSTACANGRFVSLAQYHPPALRLERTIRDLFGFEPVGMPDARSWLDHGKWGVQHPLRAPQAVPAEPSQYRFLEAEGDGVHRMIVGPVHAGTIEPGVFMFSTAGETVVRLEQRLGYTHKGTEGLMRGADLTRAARLSGRVSGDSTVAYAYAFARAAEAALDLEVPPRAMFLRVLMAELERLANHFGDFGAVCNDASFALMHAQCGVLREYVLRTANACFGHRFMRDRIVVGGVTNDLSAEAMAEVRKLLAEARHRLPRLVELYDNTASLLDRTSGAGILSAELARQYACGGYVGRASGRNFDARKTPGYAPYDRLRFDVPVLEEGDVNARVLIRIREIEQSLSLLEQVIEQLPPGPIATDFSAVASAPREGIAMVESFRGDVLVWLRLGPDGRVARCHLRDPSWFQWPVLEAAIAGNIVADFPLCNKSFNCAYSGHDL